MRTEQKIAMFAILNDCQDLDYLTIENVFNKLNK